jgi:DNA invertase Pin-like site-specific DNA recombinase
MSPPISHHGWLSTGTALSRAAAGAPWRDAVFVEQGISGGVPFSERPQGSILLARLQPGDIVIAAKLDRCFRDAADGLATVRELERRRVTLFLLDLGGDVTKHGIPRLLVTMLAAVAEFERHRIAERIAEARNNSVCTAAFSVAIGRLAGGSPKTARA